MCGGSRVPSFLCKSSVVLAWRLSSLEGDTMTAPAAPPQSGTAPSPANIQLLQLSGAAWASRCVHVVAQLGVADHIGDTPQSTDSLAKATGTQPEALYRVLRLLASLGVFEWKDGAWGH